MKNRDECPNCDRPIRVAGHYICNQCSSQMHLFNHVRPPEMQGAAVPIYTPWVSAVTG